MGVQGQHNRELSDLARYRAEVPFWLRIWNNVKATLFVGAIFAALALSMFYGMK